MKKCIRCGKDIDIISRDPEKVFYCRACSLKLMNLSEEDLSFEEEEIIIEESTFWSILIKVIKSLIPGLHQFLEKSFLKGMIYTSTSLITPFAWISLLLYSIIQQIDEKIKFGILILGFFILINAVLVFIKNLIEIWKEGEE